jgi:hypothetical protein
MKKCAVTMGVMLLCLSAAVSATKILWVSDAWQDAAPLDSGFVNRLIAEGYTVNRLQNPRTMNTAQRDLANTYDLVIIGRRTTSGEYNNTGEAALWNSITAPMINMNAFHAKSDRWKWLNNTGTFNTSANVSVTLTSDPIFAGVVLNENNQVGVVSQGVTSLVSTISAGNGTLVGYRAVEQAYVWLARWNAGVVYYPGSDQTAGGPRLAFFAGEAGGAGDGVYNLTVEGEKMFLNAVYQMSGATFDRRPIVGAGADRIVYVGNVIQLAGSVYDPEGAASVDWSAVGGPGEVSFSNPSILNPEVSFDVKGTYTLKLTGSDTANVVSDTLTVYVRDHADDKLLSHWDFEGLPDPNVLVDRVGGFNGVFIHKVAGAEPNTIPGHMSPTAVDFAVQQYWNVPGTTANVDPNYNSTQTGLSIAAWVKIESSPITATPSLISFDMPAGWRFQVNANRWNLSQSGSPERNVFSIRQPFRPQWQHVVAVFDGVNSQMKIYIDGILDNTATMPSGYRLGIGTMSLQIGNRADADRLWPGMVDDLRVYNYAISNADILALAAAGDKAPYITAGPDQQVFYKGEPVQMAATLLVNDGLPNPLALVWSVVSVPVGADPADVVFDDPTAEDPFVTFPPITGVYTLKLAGNDGALQVEDNVVVTLTIPTCADVLADGRALKGDLSGPAGVPDCVIDLYDFAVMASGWLDCNDPQDTDCIWPY